MERKSQIIYCSLDARIPFVVQWVWVYGFVYYVLFGLPLAFFSGIDQCLKCISGGFAILLLSSLVHLLWPGMRLRRDS
jgi:hypothetical protein